MGDLIEIKTLPSYRNIFYKISSNGIAFEVKGDSSATIGLAQKPGDKCDIWVVIGDGVRTWIQDGNSRRNSCSIPDLLSETDYRRFWLTWKDGSIQLGLRNEKTPILSTSNNLNLSYITFTSLTELYWRFELPPILERPKQIKPVTGGELQWVPADNLLPDGALIGGYELETLYIIRAHHHGSLTPGKFVPSQGAGYIAWGGGEHEKNEFEVLCGFDCLWVPTTADVIPVGAVEGGYSEAEREPLFVGRAFCNGHILPGKVQPSHKCCYTPYDGREIGHTNYEILVCPKINIRSANRIFLNHRPMSPPESDSDTEEDNIFE